MKTKIIIAILLITTILSSAATTQAQWIVDPNWTVHDTWTVNDVQPSTSPTPTPAPSTPTGSTGSSGSSGSNTKKVIIQITRDGEPVSDLTIYLSNDHYDLYETTNKKGEVTFNVKKGIYTLTVYSDNLLTETLHSTTIEVTKSQTFKLDLTRQTVTPSDNPIIDKLKDASNDALSSPLFLILIGCAGVALVILLFKPKKR